MNSIAGLLAAPAVSAATQLIGGAAKMTSDSFAAVMEAAKRHQQESESHCGSVAAEVNADATDEGDQAGGLEQLYASLGF